MKSNKHNQGACGAERKQLISALGRIKEKNEALQESEAKFKALAEKSLVGMYILQDGFARYANPHLAKIFGYTMKEILKVPVLDLVYSEDRPIAAENIRKRLAGEIKSIHYSIRGVRRDKKVIQIEIYGTLAKYRGKSAIIGTLIDITGKVEAEKILFQANNALKEAQRIARIGSWDWDPVADKPIWSEEMFRIFGINPKSPAVVYKDVHRLYTPESWQRLSAAVQKCIKSGKSYDVEVEIVNPDGTRKWAIARGERIKDGLAPLIRGTVQDITEQKKKEEAVIAEKARYEAMVRGSIDGFWLIEPSTGRLTDVNEAYCQMSGYSREELLKMKISDLDVKEDPAEVRRHIELVLEKGYDRFDSQHKRKDGAIFDVEVSVTFTEPGGFYFAFIRDITERKNLERAQRDFVSIASHQLQTPLTIIRWYTERLRDKKMGELSDAQMEHLGEIYRSAGDMSKLITDLLNVARIESGHISIATQPIDMIKLIHEILKRYGTKIKKETCRIDIESSEHLPPINLDASIMKQIITNLLMNAINYSKPGGCIIKIIVEKRASDFLLTIKDEGIGIPADVQSRVFEKFFRGDNAQKKKTHGTGLGLYITKIVAEAAGCRIWFQSKEDVGSTFYVAIPLKGMKTQVGERTLSEESDSDTIATDM
ncbi:MAG: PAS domain S-box protein [Candidatus Nealsonbacteria bacterium]|nr:PAS domain S-box protein [Candidatus Nealsonbacteria bacterium]